MNPNFFLSPLLDEYCKWYLVLTPIIFYFTICLSQHNSQRQSTQVAKVFANLGKCQHGKGGHRPDGGEWDLNIANLCKSQVVLEAFLWSVATLYENIFRRWVFRLNTFCLFLYAAFSKINYPNGIMRLGWVSHSTFNYSLCLRDGTRKKQVFHSNSFHTRNAELIHAWLMIVNARQEHISTPLLKK